MSAEQERAAMVAKGLTKAERRCLLTWGDPDLSKRVAVPDSIWHGRLRHLKVYALGEGNHFVLSPFGLAVREHLRDGGDA